MKGKQKEYAAKLIAHVMTIFEDEDSDYYINKEDFHDDDNITVFIHVLANIAPCFLYNRLTGDDKNALEFNHIANQLIFQNSTNSGEKKEIEPSTK